MFGRYFVASLILVVHWEIFLVYGLADMITPALANWPKWAKVMTAFDLLLLPPVGLMALGDWLDGRHKAAEVVNV